MKLGVLFSGGKDSTYAAWLAKKSGNDLICLITLHSENLDSYMFHTPSIKMTEVQAKVMGLPLLIGKTEGEKEKELDDLREIIKKAKKKFGIQGIVTGALHSVYQASRIEKICKDLGLESVNPLWHKNEFEYLEELVKSKFDIVIIGVSAFPLDGTWLGRKIDEKFIEDTKVLNEKYKIHAAGEGGEFETFVLYAPGLFKKPLKIIEKTIYGEDNYWRMEIKVKED